MLSQSHLAASICRERVSQINCLQNPPECVLLNGSTIRLSRLIAAHISPNDEVSFPVLPSSVTAATEICVKKNSLVGSARCVYQAQIGYVTQPKKDKREELFVAARVCPPTLGISSILISCKALREYFYRIPRNESPPDRRTLYDILRISSAASPAELRVGFKLCQLELRAKNDPRNERSFVERAFNILGDPELRACYDRLLKDPEAPALFPYGGFGSLLAYSALPYASVTSTMIAPSTVICAGNWSYGSIRLFCTRFGIPPGTNGNICSEQRWR